MSKTKVIFNHEKLQTSCDLMRALAHPLRLKILEFIDRNGTINVNNIYNTLNIEQSITSQHLKIMRLAGVIDAYRDGKFVHYSVNYEIVKRAEIAVNNFLKKSKA